MLPDRRDDDRREQNEKVNLVDGSQSIAMDSTRSRSLSNCGLTILLDNRKERIMENEKVIETLFKGGEILEKVLSDGSSVYAVRVISRDGESVAFDMISYNKALNFLCSFARNAN